MSKCYLHRVIIIQPSHINLPDLKMLPPVFPFEVFLSKIPFGLKDRPLQRREKRCPGVQLIEKLVDETLRHACVQRVGCISGELMSQGRSTREVGKETEKNKGDPKSIEAKPYKLSQLAPIPQEAEVQDSDLSQLVAFPDLGVLGVSHSAAEIIVQRANFASECPWATCSMRIGRMTCGGMMRHVSGRWRC